MNPLPRALVVGAGLALGALGAVRFFHDGTWLGTVFALWSFWLLQAGLALIPRAASRRAGPSPRSSDTHAGDPFEQAHAAAVAILEHRR